MRTPAQPVPRQRASSYALSKPARALRAPAFVDACRFGCASSSNEKAAGCRAEVVSVHSRLDQQLYFDSGILYLSQLDDYVWWYFKAEGRSRFTIEKLPKARLPWKELQRWVSSSLRFNTKGRCTAEARRFRAKKKCTRSSRKDSLMMNFYGMRVSPASIFQARKRPAVRRTALSLLADSC